MLEIIGLPKSRAPFKLALKLLHLTPTKQKLKPSQVYSDENSSFKNETKSITPYIDKRACSKAGFECVNGCRLRKRNMKQAITTKLYHNLLTMLCQAYSM